MNKEEIDKFVKDNIQWITTILMILFTILVGLLVSIYMAKTI
jgi:uncharacterized membrane protein YwzB